MSQGFLSDIARNLLEARGIRHAIDKIDLLTDNRLCTRGMFAQAFGFKVINDVPGDYFEFGLWRGTSFIVAHRMKHRYRLNEMKLWGFDSFEGLPEIDDPRDNTWSQGQYACSQAELRRTLRRRGVRATEYELIPGYFDRSLNAELHNRLAGRQAAVVHVDCDLYSSTKLVLNFLKPYLVNGTIACFDDYYHYKGNPNQGEQKALSEFLKQNNRFSFLPWLDYSSVGKSFIVRLRDDASC